MEISEIFKSTETILLNRNKESTWDSLPHTKEREKWVGSTYAEKVQYLKELQWHCFKKRLISKLEMNEAEQQLYPMLRDQFIARYLPEYKSVLNPMKGLILCGSVGVGKTTFLESIAEAEFYLDNVILNPNIIDTESSINNALKGRHSVIINEEQREFAKQKTPEISPDLLYRSMLFDEFGETKDENVKIMGNSIEFIIDILYKRNQKYNRALQNGSKPRTTMLTSNLSKGEIIERYNQKNVDRLFQMCEIIEWKGESKRR